MTLHRCCACAGAGFGTSCCLFYQSPQNPRSPLEDVIEASDFIWTGGDSAPSRETVPTSPHRLPLIDLIVFWKLGGVGEHVARGRQLEPEPKLWLLGETEPWVRAVKLVIMVSWEKERGSEGTPLEDLYGSLIRRQSLIRWPQSGTSFNSSCLPFLFHVSF